MVVVTLKTLKQTMFKIEIEATQTIKDLKQKIFETNGSEYQVEHQKLIYAGKILQDDMSISEYNDESKFMVVMVTKPKVAAAPPPAAASAASTSADGADSKKPEATATNTAENSLEESTPKKEEESSSAPSTSADPVASASAALLTGEQYEESVKQLTDMGYDREDVVKAMRAGFNNPDRAVEYLINGIPEDILAENMPRPRARPGRPLPPGSGSVIPGLSGSPLQFLRTLPQFRQMRQMVQQNPSLLNQVLQQLGSTNPELLQLISRHQEDFVRMLNEPLPPPDPTSNHVASLSEVVESGAAAAAAAIEDSAAMADSIPLAVSQEDKEAIERLKALGFPESDVVQAYFACDKNENLAANLLLSNGFTDD